jgi:hypothetical protein
MFRILSDPENSSLEDLDPRMVFKVTYFILALIFAVAGKCDEFIALL